MSVWDRSASYAGRRGIVGVHRERRGCAARVLLHEATGHHSPVVIVLLSFSVFWMDRSSLGDRLASRSSGS